MGVSTELRRNGERVVLPNGWGHFHLGCLYDAAMREDPTIDDSGDRRWYGWFPNDPAEYVFQMRHTYEDETDGEIFTIMPGDVYAAWR